MNTPISILDGGLGTSLEQKYGLKFGPSTPLWSSHLLVSDPDTLQQCQGDFGEVPVDILLTATYQVSVEGFAKTVTAEYPDGIPASRIPNFVCDAVGIAEKAKSRDGKIALSLGPYGACMTPSQEYSGEYDDKHDSGEALEAWHHERLGLFTSISDLQGRVSYLSLETIPRLDEIKALRRSLDAVPQLAAIPFWMSCLYPGEDLTLPSGDTIESTIEAMLDPGAAKAIPWGVGINCTKVWKLDSILRQYEKAIKSMLEAGRISRWPALVLYPDGTNGEVYNTATQAWEVPDGEEMEDRLPWEKQLAEVVRATESRGEWVHIVVGGCCMAGAEDIRRLRQLLK